MLHGFCAAVIKIPLHFVAGSLVRKTGGHLGSASLAVDKTAEKEIFVDTKFFRLCFVKRLSEGEHIVGHKRFMSSVVYFSSVLDLSGIDYVPKNVADVGFTEMVALFI